MRNIGLLLGLVGTAFSVLMRIELSGLGVQFIADNQLYNSMITVQAILMIFFMVMPCLIEGFGSFMLPLMVGGPDIGFSRLNNISFSSRNTDIGNLSENPDRDVTSDDANMSNESETESVASSGQDMPQEIVTDSVKTYDEFSDIITRECKENSDLIITKSGTVLNETREVDIDRIATLINEVDDKEVAQEAYDNYYDNMVRVSAAIKENALDDRKNELEKLKLDSVNHDEDIDDKRKIIEDEHDRISKENDNYDSHMKGLLRSSITREDLTLRGMDENNEESVANHHMEVDSTGNYGDSLLKISNLDNKRSRPDSSQQEDSSVQNLDVKRFKQDSSNVEYEFDPSDYYGDE